DYRSLRVEWEEPTVPEEEIQKELEAIAERYAAWEPKEGPIAEGDLVVVDLKGETEAGEPLMESEGRSLIVRLDSVYPVPGFHEELLGLQAGESKEFTLPFPEDSSNKELAGKPVRFRVTVKEVQRRDVPAIDDGLAMLAGDYENLDALREEIRERLLQQRYQEAQEAYEGKVLDALREISRVEYPAVALEQELDRILEMQEERLARQGLNMETYLSMLKTTAEAYREGLKPMAEQRLVHRLLLAKVAEAEGLEPEAQEVEEAMEEAVREAEQASDPELARKREVLKAAVAEYLGRGQALQWLVRVARGEVQDAGEEGETPVEEAGAEEGAPVAQPEAQGSEAAPADE
ncbi:MAG: trigger factor, partial [Anaerolineae bacterium]|nr:trigger factor [Anaerolineae bacterium]